MLCDEEMQHKQISIMASFEITQSADEKYEQEMKGKETTGLQQLSQRFCHSGPASRPLEDNHEKMIPGFNRGWG